MKWGMLDERYTVVILLCFYSRISISGEISFSSTQTSSHSPCPSSSQYGMSASSVGIGVPVAELDDTVVVSTDENGVEVESFHADVTEVGWIDRLCDSLDAVMEDKDSVVVGVGVSLAKDTALLLAVEVAVGRFVLDLGSDGATPVADPPIVVLSDSKVDEAEPEADD
jgi:hypothetical protein